MNLMYFQKLKNLQNEFISSQRKAFSTVDFKESPLHVSLNIFREYETIEIQDTSFEITEEKISPQKLGTALTEICSLFNSIEKVLNKYIELCNNIEHENSTFLIETQILTPLFLELGETVS